MAKATPPPTSTSVLNINLPSVDTRDPYKRPQAHLVKDKGGTWKQVKGRRASDLLLVTKLRAAVDRWRDSRYPGASPTTLRLLSYWFDDSHAVGGAPFRYYFCQREAVETIIYLFEIHQHRDCQALIEAFADGSPEVFVNTDGSRGLIRAGAKPLDLPPQGLARAAIKMATGAGKTVVIALLVAWSYLNNRRERRSTLADSFLIVAPNVIVYERLKEDFKNGEIFRRLPIIPSEWQSAWRLQVILRSDPTQPKASGNLFLTNIHQIYAERETNEPPINPIQTLLGEAPKGIISAPTPLLDRIRSVSRLMVLNDEAHHVHDDELRWNTTLLSLDDHLKATRDHGLAAWIDLSATPKNQGGAYFPWVVTDYPLAQVVEDKIVKTPLVIRRPDSADVLAVAVHRWRTHVTDYGAIGERPILFIMAESSKEADEVSKQLEGYPDLKGHVLTIHTNKFGDVSKKEEDALRKASRELDQGKKYKAVVSVLMLREGWDVRNVSVIVGLRAFSAKANILPEQAVGRGLRLMRKIPAGETQILEIIGTEAFEQFVLQLEQEGVGITSTDHAPNPSQFVYPDQARAEFDIDIPKTTPLYQRQYKNLSKLNPKSLPPLTSAADLTDAQRQRIDLIHGTLDVTVHSDVIAFNADHLPMAEDLLSTLTQRTMETARITGFFPQIYPIVRDYVRDRCFDGRVALDDVEIRRALHDAGLRDMISTLIARHIGALTIEQQSVAMEGAPWRLSQTPGFLWSRHITQAEKTVFNVVACFNKFEADFARFLDKAADVSAFAKLCEQFTGFHIQYIKSSGALAAYYPDFVAVQEHRGGAQTRWIIETKGQEDAEVAAKDAQMRRWCAEVSRVAGTPWRYAKVPYDVFQQVNAATLGGLIKLLKQYEVVLNTTLVSEEASMTPQPPPANGPPPEVTARFWSLYGQRVRLGVIVAASRQELDPMAVRDVMNAPILQAKGLPSSGFLFFVDLNPEANWAHPCAYAFVGTEGKTDWQEAEWPPHSDLSLKTQEMP
jgi:type III restriction enzyme